MNCPYPLLLIKWEDSCSHGDAWNRIRDLEPDQFEPTTHFSVGWELKRTARAVTIAPNVGILGDEHNECASGHFTIPLAVILRETVLRKAKP